MAGTEQIRRARRVAVVVMAAASTAIVGIAAGPVRAGIAPDAVSKGTAVAVRPLDSGVSLSSASAGEDGASSKAVGVRVLGRDVASTSSGGNDERTDATSSSRVPLTGGRVQVAPRSTSSRSTSDDARSAAHTDLVTANIPNLVSLEVLSSDAEAVWTPRASSSNSQVDGAKVDLFEGGLVVVLMHADGSSDGRGRVYLVRINDATYFDSARSGHMTLSVPDIFTIELLGTKASGGRFTGQVLRTAWLDDDGLTQLAAAVEASGGSAAGRITSDTFALKAASVDAGDATDGPGVLPLSGAPILVLVLAALTLIEIGAGLTLVRTGAHARA